MSHPPVPLQVMYKVEMEQGWGRGGAGGFRTLLQSSSSSSSSSVNLTSSLSALGLASAPTITTSNASSLPTTDQALLAAISSNVASIANLQTGIVSNMNYIDTTIQVA